MSFDKELIKQYYPEAEDLMIEPMKIWKLPAGKEYMFSEICESGDYFAEEKIDGAWYQFVKTNNYSYLFGRTISVKTNLLTEKGANVPHILEAFSCLPPKTILIGEVYYPGQTSRNTVTIMGCLPERAIARQKGNPIHYYVHDIIYCNGVNLIDTPAYERYNILKELWTEKQLDKYDFLKLAEIFEDEIAEKVAAILAKGGEGAVLKKKDLPYYPDKRPAWSTVKIKQADTVDMVCMGFCDATKEYTGKELETWQYWEGDIPVTKGYYYGWKTAMRIGAYDENGKLAEVGTVSSGLTDEDREGMAANPEKYLNKVVELGCMSISKADKTLRHPTFIRLRDDKDAKDCLMSEIFS